MAQKSREMASPIADKSKGRFRDDAITRFGYDPVDEGEGRDGAAVRPEARAGKGDTVRQYQDLYELARLFSLLSVMGWDGGWCGGAAWTVEAYAATANDNDDEVNGAAEKWERGRKKQTKRHERGRGRTIYSKNTPSYPPSYRLIDRLFFGALLPRPTLHHSIVGYWKTAS